MSFLVALQFKTRILASLLLYAFLPGLASAQPALYAEPLATEPTINAVELADRMENVPASWSLTFVKASDGKAIQAKLDHLKEVAEENIRRFRFAKSMSASRWKTYNESYGREMKLTLSMHSLVECLAKKPQDHDRVCENAYLTTILNFNNMTALSIADFVQKGLSRPPIKPIKLGHVIGAVTVDIRSRRANRLKLASKVASAEDEVASVKRAIDRLEQESSVLDAEFNKVFAAQADRLKPLQDRFLKASGNAPVEKGPQKPTRQTEIALLRKERRIGKIDAALDYLNRQVNGKQPADVRERIAALTSERSRLQSEIEAAVNPSPDQKTKKSDELAQQEFDSAKREYLREVRAMAQMVRTAHAPIDIKQDAIVSARDRLWSAQQQLDEATTRLANFDQQTLSSFKSITTSHANIIFKNNPQESLDQYDSLIRDQQKELQDVLRKKSAARKNMIKLMSGVIEDADTLSHDVILSWLGQASLQWVVQTAETARTSKGSRIGFIASAFTQMAVNLLNPPPLYTARLKDGKIIADTGDPLDQENLRIAGAELVTSSGRKWAEQSGLAAFRKLVSKGIGASSAGERVLYGQLRRQVGTAITDSRISVKFLKDQAIAAALAVGTEKAKQYWAVKSQTPALNTFLSSQAALSSGIELLHILDELEDADTKNLAVLQARRAKIVTRVESADRLSFQPAVQYELNRVFDGDAGYTLTVDVAGQQGTEPYKLKVLLDGQSLQAGTYPGSFVFNENHEAYFEKAERPFALPMTIEMD